MRTFEFSEGSSHKFWGIELSGESFTVTFGKVGTAGQSQTKQFASAAAAQKEHDKLIAEKLRKGYREKAAAKPAAPKPSASPLRESLEQALAEDPDDLVSHMAYADYLSEQGDPLGKFVRVQLALEDEKKPAAARKKLQAQEKKLFAAHAPDWLGDLAPYCLGEWKTPEGEYLNIERDITAGYTLRRGWLDSLTGEGADNEFSRSLARSPQVRLLRRLQIMGNDEDVPDMAGSPYLGNVKTFTVGELDNPEAEINGGDGGVACCHTYATGVVGVVKKMPKLEELYLLAHALDAEKLFSLPTLGNLRILLVYHATSYPLARLAKNASLANLTHFLTHPHAPDVNDEQAYIREPAVKALVNSPHLKSLTHLQLRNSDMGDKGIKTIIASGILKRLKVLDLRHGCVTDAGARTLAACPDVKKLERLDLTNNALTEAGIQALAVAGAKVMADEQHPPDDGDRSYLYFADYE